MTNIPFDWPDHPERTTVASSYCNDCLHPGHAPRDCVRCYRELNNVSPLHEYTKVECQLEKRADG